jgi:hypothetical protein
LAQFLAKPNQYMADSPEANATAVLQGNNSRFIYLFIIIIYFFCVWSIMKMLIHCVGISQQKSILVCSNLRRALSTLCIGLQQRLSRTNEKVQQSNAIFINYKY